LLPVIFSLIGLIGIAIGIVMLRKQTKLYQVCTAQAIGAVTGIQRKKSGKSSNYHTTFTYPARDTEYVKTVITSGNKFSVGQRITVFYNPSDPDKHYVFKDKWTWLFIFAFGAVFMAIGILALFVFPMGQ